MSPLTNVVKLDPVLAGLDLRFSKLKTKIDALTIFSMFCDIYYFQYCCILKPTRKIFSQLIGWDPEIVSGLIWIYYYF